MKRDTLYDSRGRGWRERDFPDIFIQIYSNANFPTVALGGYIINAADNSLYCYKDVMLLSVN